MIACRAQTFNCLNNRFWFGPLSGAHRFRGILESVGITARNLYWCPNDLKEAQKDCRRCWDLSSIHETCSAYLWSIALGLIWNESSLLLAWCMYKHHVWKFIEAGNRMYQVHIVADQLWKGVFKLLCGLKDLQEPPFGRWYSIAIFWICKFFRSVKPMSSRRRNPKKPQVTWRNRWLPRLELSWRSICYHQRPEKAKSFAKVKWSCEKNERLVKAARSEMAKFSHANLYELHQAGRKKDRQICKYVGWKSKDSDQQAIPFWLWVKRAKRGFS